MCQAVELILYTLQAYNRVHLCIFERLFAIGLCAHPSKRKGGCASLTFRG